VDAAASSKNAAAHRDPKIGIMFSGKSL